MYITTNMKAKSYISCTYSRI